MPRQSYVRRKPYRANSYNISSTAYEYYPNYAYPYPQYEQRPVQPKRKNKAGTYYKTKEESPVFVGKIAIGLVVFFGFALCMLCSSIDISNKKAEIIELNTQLENVNETNNYYEAELNKSIDLAEIERIAINKLGMQYPTKYQTIYIDVPKDSYTVQYVENEKADTNKFDSFVNQLKDIFE